MIKMPKWNSGPGAEAKAIESALLGKIGELRAAEKNLPAAEAAVEAAQNQAVPDDVAAGAQRANAILAAERHRNDLKGKIAGFGVEISALEEELRALRAKAEQQEHARTVKRVADSLGTETAAFAEAGAKVLALAKELAALMPGLASDFIPRVGELITALPTGLRQLVGDAHAHAAQLESGHAQLHRPAPQPAPEPAAPQVARATVYALSALRWVEDGRTVLAPQYGWCAPPARLATLAVERGLAGPPDSEHVRRVIQSHGLASGPAPGAPERAIDLDHLDAPAAEQPAEGQPRTPPMFEERIGATRQMEIQVSRT
jgi:hypothetical protein